MQNLAGGDAQIEGKMAVGKAASPPLVTIPQGVERAALGVFEFFPTAGPTSRSSIETGSATFVRVTAHAVIETHIPSAQSQSNQNHQAEEEVED